ncbi:citrate synthase [Candidatus Chloroploca asiatica]|uniref:Citrate synthase n=1 Tax=Candidatus Chloroploca asiatica TaxID=1506545 RepID=A0A2H3KTG9_9CHLR|nr:citrate synthase [Candidatus Chloroploca asiatica]PDV98584.1 citrate synthase [Candidatus Chloroploca asiatica]
MTQSSKGLEGIVAAQTGISHIDGEHGRLLYRGLDINVLAEHSTFEETTSLLWYGKLPNCKQYESFRRKMIENRLVPNEVIALLLLLPKKTTVMGVLRTAVSALAPFDPETGDNSLDANVNKSIRLTAAMPTIVAAWERIRNGLWPVTPSIELDHAANFLYMLTGKEPDPAAARVLDQCLILHADHGLNASTFAARITASTLSNLHSAITSAIGTLRGPLHGGANEQVMRMLLEIGDVDRVDHYMRGALAARKKIMGFGHRVYKADDPRAAWLRSLAGELAETTGNQRWYLMSERIREIVQSERSLPVNVDFYSASVYYTLGIPIDLFTPIFAISRVAGWTAHVYEQYADNRLIRPESEYVGPVDVPYLPLDQRS